MEGRIGLSFARDDHRVEHGDGEVGTLVALGAQFEFGRILECAVGLVMEPDAVVGRGGAGQEGIVDGSQAARGAEIEGAGGGLDRLPLREEADELFLVELHRAADFRLRQGRPAAGHDGEEFVEFHRDDRCAGSYDVGVFAGGQVILEDHDLERHGQLLGRPCEAGFRSGASRHGPRQGGPRPA